MDNKVLIVEDEANIRELLEALLQSEGYTVQSSANGKDGLREYFSFHPDVVLLDIHMPQMDGWALLDRIREVSESPVIFITALGTEPDKLRGLKAGADDYIVKPFSTKEVLARVEAVLRRSPHLKGTETAEVYRDEALTIDFGQHRIFVQGHEVRFTATEFKLVVAFAHHAGQVLSADQLLDLAWGMEAGSNESVRLYIGYVRHKLEEAGGPDLIETVRGVGYRYRPQGTGT